MANEVYEALGIWASIPTWHTGHGTDERRFDEAIAELDATVASVTFGEVRAALWRYREESPEILGGKATDREVDQLAQRVITALADYRAGG